MSNLNAEMFLGNFNVKLDEAEFDKNMRVDNYYEKFYSKCF